MGQCLHRVLMSDLLARVPQPRDEWSGLERFAKPGFSIPHSLTESIDLQPRLPVRSTPATRPSDDFWVSCSLPHFPFPSLRHTLVMC